MQCRPAKWSASQAWYTCLRQHCRCTDGSVVGTFIACRARDWMAVDMQAEAPHRQHHRTQLQGQLMYIVGIQCNRVYECPWPGT